MDTETLQVQTLGSFVIRCADKQIADSDNRSKKVWLMLAYILCHRGAPIPQETLADLCWGEERDQIDSNNAIKTLLHRVRLMLDKLFPDAGKTCIIFKDGCCLWNPNVSVSMDSDEFEAICKEESKESKAGRLERCCKAIDLYHGDFLPKLSTELWVITLSEFYHKCYVDLVLEAAALLEEQKSWQDLTDICRRGAAFEPYNEELCAYLMRSLLAVGKQKEAIAVYDEMSGRLFANFGVMPAEELRKIQREAVALVNKHTVSAQELLEQLTEKEAPQGAMFCDYDFFRILYHAEVRSLPRSGSVAHLCILSVEPLGANPLSRRSLDRVMENFKVLIRARLRRGDMACQCSTCQFLILLPRANYENSAKVCERLLDAFYRQYPKTPARVQYEVVSLQACT